MTEGQRVCTSQAVGSNSSAPSMRSDRLLGSTRSAADRVTRTPTLRPQCLVPQRCSRTTTSPLRFLATIERVEIASVERFCDVTYYVVDVYLQTPDQHSAPTSISSSSRNSSSSHCIPTTRLPKLSEPQSSKHHQTKRSTSATTSRPSADARATAQPAFRTARRFSSFDALHKQLTAVSSALEPITSATACDCCSRLHRFTAHSLRLAKLCSNVALRKRLLTQFLQHAVKLAVEVASRSRSGRNDSNVCGRCHTVAQLVDDFIRRDMSAIERVEALA